MAANFRSIVVCGATIALCGCNLSSGAPGPTAVAVAPAAAKPDWPPLPEGAACTGDLNKFQTLLGADVSTGNLNRSVYDQIQTDLEKAAQACADGHDAEAHRIIHAAKAKHGYHG